MPAPGIFCVACGLLLGGTLAAVGAWIISDLRSVHISHEKQNLTNLSYILAEEMDRRLEVLDLLHRGLIEHMRQLGVASLEAFEQHMGSIEVHRDLSERIAGLPHVAALSLHDRTGNLINFSRSWPPPRIDVRDRDFIRMVLAPGAPKLFISAPVRSQTTGQWTIYFSSRFEAPDGQLIGIVVSSILADHFEQLFSQIAVGGDGSFGLYRSDGMLLVRYPHVDSKIGTALGQTDNYNRMHGALDHGIARLTSMFDGKDRLVAGHTVSHYPLIISVGNTIDAALEAWRNESRAFAMVTAFLELVIAVTVVLAVRHLHGYEMLQAAEAARARAEERERGANALHQQGQRFDTALNNMLQGLLMFGHDSRLLVVNRRFFQMFGVPDGALAPGMTYIEVTDRVIEAGQVTAEDMAGVREHRAELVVRNERATATWEICQRPGLRDDSPANGGWLAHHVRGDQRSPPDRSQNGASRAPRCADRSAESRAVPQETAGRAGVRAARMNAWRCSASTSTSSRRSTTRSGTRSAMRCCRQWLTRLVRRTREDATLWRGSAAMSLPSFRHRSQSRPRRPVLPIG